MKLQACIQIWWKLLKWTESPCSPSVWQFAQNVLGQPQFQKALAKIAKIVWQPLQPIAGCIQPLQLTVAIWLWKVGIAVRWLSGHQNFEDYRRTLVPRNHNGQNWCDLPVEPKKKSYKDEFPPHSIMRCHEVTFVQSDFVRFSAAQDALEDGSADRNL